MDKHFEAQEVKVFGRMFDKGFIYKGLKPVTWCPFCTTAVDPPTKKKKRRGGGQKAVGAVMYVLMIIGISLIISSFAIVTVNDVFALVSDGDRSVTLVFSEENTSVKEVAEALEDSGMIRYKWAFRLYAGLKKAGAFKAGTFEIKDSYENYRFEIEVPFKIL